MGPFLKVTVAYESYRSADEAPVAESLNEKVVMVRPRPGTPPICSRAGAVLPGEAVLIELAMAGICTGLILNDVLNYVLLRSMSEVPI
jgi:hypothetical protein